MCSLCGVLHGEGGPVDPHGCRLPDNHAGPHECVDPKGVVWLWETDFSCTCAHCMQGEGDYCTLYWRKPAAGTWVAVTERMPAYGQEVLCRLRYADGGDMQEHRLLHVNESDVTWRLPGGRGELSYDWTVTEWLDERLMPHKG